MLPYLKPPCFSTRASLIVGRLFDSGCFVTLPSSPHHVRYDTLIYPSFARQVFNSRWKHLNVFEFFRQGVVVVKQIHGVKFSHVGGVRGGPEVKYGNAIREEMLSQDENLYSEHVKLLYEKYVNINIISKNEEKKPGSNCWRNEN